VADHHGSYVTNLRKEDFQVYADGKIQTISQFARTDAAVTIGLIVDNSGSMRYKRNEVVMAGLAFAKASNPQDEFFVVNFNDSVVAGLPAGVAFTDRIEILHKALYMGKSEGQTALYDAIASGIKHLEEGHHDKRTLIVVSDGGDNISHLKEPDIINLIQESRATIYTIGLLDPDDKDLKPAILKKFASISGGEYFQPEKLDDVVGVLDKISKDIRSRYTLGFSPSQESASNEIHKIKVTAVSEGKRLTVRSRTTYKTYGQ
jgi:VWFA-related protein